MAAQRLVSIICSLMTGFCPFFCTIATAHQASEPAESAISHVDLDAPAPHHEHDPCGEQEPHPEHTCICTGTTAPAGAVHAPSLKAVPHALSDPAQSDAIVGLVRGVSTDTLILTHPPNDSRSLPLLI